MNFNKKFDVRFGLKGEGVNQLISEYDTEEYQLWSDEGVAVVPDKQKYGGRFFIYNSIRSDNEKKKLEKWMKLFEGINESQKEDETIL